MMPTRLNPTHANRDVVLSQVVEMRLEAFGGGAMERPALFLMLSDGSLLTYRSTVHGGRLRFVRFDVGWLATGLLRPPGAPQLAPGLSRMTRVDDLRKDSPVAGVVSDRSSAVSPRPSLCCRIVSGLRSRI